MYSASMINQWLAFKIGWLAVEGTKSKFITSNIILLFPFIFPNIISILKFLNAKLCYPNGFKLFQLAPVFLSFYSWCLLIQFWIERIKSKASIFVWFSFRLFFFASVVKAGKNRKLLTQIHDLPFVPAILVPETQILWHQPNWSQAKNIILILFDCPFMLANLFAAVKEKNDSSSSFSSYQQQIKFHCSPPSRIGSQASQE